MNIIDKYSEYKKSDEYKRIQKELMEENPEMFMSSMELTIYAHWYENEWRTYCMEEGLTFVSLLDQVDEVSIPKKPEAEQKGIHSYTSQEFEEYIKTKEKIKGVEDIKIIQEEKEEIPIELPNLN